MGKYIKKNDIFQGKLIEFVAKIWGKFDQSIEEQSFELCNRNQAIVGFLPKIL